MKFLLWSRRFNRWYSAPGQGLTLDIDKAYRYTEDEVEQHCREIQAEGSLEGTQAEPEVIVMIEGEK